MAQTSEKNDDAGPLIGIFYSSLNSDICKRVVDVLKEANFNIVPNIHQEEENKDQLPDQEQWDIPYNITDALDSASVVLVFLSTSYFQTKYCKWLLNEALLDKKPLLWLVIEKDFEPSGWIGQQLSEHPFVRWRDDDGYIRFIDNVKRKIIELIPSPVPTATDCEILAKFDSIISLFDEKNSSKSDVDEICQSICLYIESDLKSNEDPKVLLPMAVEIFRKYNMIVNRIDDRLVEFTKHTGDVIDSFLRRALQNAVEYNLLKNDQKRAQTTFLRVFDSLVMFPTTIYFLNEEFMTNEDSCHARILFWGACVLRLAAAEKIFQSEQDAAKFPDQQIVLQMWLKYIDENILIPSYECVSMLQKILQFLSANVSLVPVFVNACFPTTVLSWLSGNCFIYNKDLKFDALCMVYNFARHEKGADVLNQLGAIEVLKKWANDDLKEGIYPPDASLIFNITLALLYQPENIDDEQLTIEPIFKELLSKAQSASQDPQLKCGVIPLSECLLVFNTLFLTEELILKCLKQIVNEKRASPRFFSDMFMNTDKLDVLSQTILLNIIYRITSIGKLTYELNGDQAFIDKLQDLKDESAPTIYLPKYTEKIPIAVSRILRHLGIIQKNSKKESLATDIFPDKSTSQKKKVMVSYCHANGGFCEALVNELKKCPEISVWVDYLKIGHGDQWNHIAYAMEKADVVICIVTKDYVMSPSCQDELAYAIDELKMKQKNKITPIRIGKFKPFGGVAIRLTRTNYVKFGLYRGFDEKKKPPTQDPIFIKKCQEVQNRILNRINQDESGNNIDSQYEGGTALVDNINDDENIASLNITTPPKMPLSQWKKQDIAQWLQSVRVPRKLINLYKFESVEELREYIHDLKAHEDANYADIKELFTEKYGYTLKRKYFLILRDAFEQLMKNNSTTNDFQNQTTIRAQTDHVQSSFCALM